MKDTASFNPHQSEIYTRSLRVGDYTTRAVDLLEHCQVFGATGAGKTRSFVVPSIEAILRQFGSQTAEKACACIIDAKADMADFVEIATEATGRAADLRILCEDGTCWFDFFGGFNGRSEAIAGFLFDMLCEGRNGGGTNEVFWDQNARRLLEAAASLARAVHGDGFGGFIGIREAMKMLTGLKPGSVDDDEPDAVPGQLNEILCRVEDGILNKRINGTEAEKLVEFCKQDILGNAPRTWGIIANYARGFIANFADERLLQVFQPDENKERLSPERIIDEGLIVVISLSPLIYQGMEVPFLRAIKQAMCGRILMRNTLRDYSTSKPRRINQERPILFVMDEFHTTMTPGGNGNEAFFLDRAREFRCMCFLATQGVSAIHSRISDYGAARHLLNNAATKVFFRTSCPMTLEYFEILVGSSPCEVEHRVMEPLPAPSRFRLPNHAFAAPELWKARSLQREKRHEPAISASDLRSLSNGEAIVIDKTGEPKRVRFQSLSKN
jgi:hypothetical protein